MKNGRKLLSKTLALSFSYLILLEKHTNGNTRSIQEARALINFLGYHFSIINPQLINSKIMENLRLILLVRPEIQIEVLVLLCDV